jgi:hypothetical protein
MSARHDTERHGTGAGRSLMKLPSGGLGMGPGLGSLKGGQSHATLRRHTRAALSSAVRVGLGYTPVPLLTISKGKEEEKRHSPQDCSLIRRGWCVRRRWIPCCVAGHGLAEVGVDVGGDCGGGVISGRPVRVRGHVHRYMYWRRQVGIRCISGEVERGGERWI